MSYVGEITCPNCGEPAMGLCHSTPSGDDELSVKHCGCFHEGDATGKKFHHSTEPTPGAKEDPH